MRLHSTLFFLLFLLLTPWAQAQEAVLIPAWQSEAVFDAPESVVFDRQRQVLYVSNINGNPSKADGNGYISQLALDGTLIKRHWITGLDAPKGMAIVGDHLYVADINQLLVIDIRQQKIVRRYHAPQAKFLNDVAADSKGNVYVSGFLTDAIYRLRDKQFALWLQSEKLASPNGLLIEGDNVIVASWGRMTDGFATKVPGHLLSIDLNTQVLKDLGHQPVGNLDGLEADGDGHYLVTDWMAGKLYRIDRQGRHQTLLVLGQGSADHTVLHDRQLICIPMMSDNKILAFKIKTP